MMQPRVWLIVEMEGVSDGEMMMAWWGADGESKRDTQCPWVSGAGHGSETSW